MASDIKNVRIEESPLDKASPYILLMALLGIPAAGGVALVLLVQIPRLIYGQANPLLAAAEIGSLFTVLVLVLLLHSCLQLPSAPVGFYRNVLDFLAMARWHPAVKAALVGLLVLPPAWYTHHNYSLSMLWIVGARALALSDVQNALDGFVVVYQLVLTGGVPLLFCLHMLTRSKPKRRILPWPLMPLLFVGAAIGVILLVATMHH